MNVNQWQPRVRCARVAVAMVTAHIFTRTEIQRVFVCEFARAFMCLRLHACLCDCMFKYTNF